MSARVLFGWHCVQCDCERTAPVWRIVDDRERPDVLEVLAPGVALVSCPECHSTAPIDTPLLVIRRNSSAPLLMALSFAELQGGSMESRTLLLEEATRAGAFADRAVRDGMVALPRELLPFVLSRDVELDLNDPDAAYHQLQIRGHVTLAHNYRNFLTLLAGERKYFRASELLHELSQSMPDELVQLIRRRPELTEGTEVRDVGRDHVQAAVDTELEPFVRKRQKLLEHLCDGDVSLDSALGEYFSAVEDHGLALNKRAHAMHRVAMENNGVDLIPFVREALDLVARLGIEHLETELAASLGNRLVRAARDGLQSDLHEAIAALNLVLSRSPENGIVWVLTAFDLAGAYHLLDAGDRLENWDKAHQLLVSSAAGIDRTLYPELWSRLQTSLGLIVAERPDEPSGLAAGILHIQAGLEERSPKKNNVDWAYSMLNLGLLYYRRNGPGDWGRAEACYRGALRYLHPSDEPALWSILQCNLAALLLARGRRRDVRNAKRIMVATLNFSKSQTGLLDAARINWLLAKTIEQLNGMPNAESLRLRHEALTVATPKSSSSLHLQMAWELIDIYASGSRWTEAADIATGMLVAADSLYGAQVTVVGRRSVLTEVSRTARWASFLLARAGRVEEAVKAIEHGLAYELSVVAGRDAAKLDSLAEVDSQLADRYRATHARYRNSLESQTKPSGGDVSDSHQEQAAAERELRAVIDEIRATPTFESFLRTTELEDIIRSSRGIPVVYLVNAPGGSYVLAVTSTQHACAGGESGPATATPIPIVTAHLVPTVSSNTIATKMVVDQDGVKGLLLAQHDPSRLQRRRLLPESIERLSVLAPLLEPVAALLRASPNHEIVLVPTGLLGLVPLHALAIQSETGNATLDEIGTVNLAPSAAVFGASLARAARQEAIAPRLVAVVDPDGSLPGSRVEHHEILALFQTRGMTLSAVGPDATMSWVLSNLSEVTHLHFGCHGSAEMFGAHGGSLMLADGQLDMDTIASQRLPQCRLVVASSCQSGRYGTLESPDEFRGLPAGFLGAGAACVVASLWQVNDLATALVMTRFYEALLVDGISPIPALRLARIWLREMTTEDLNRYVISHGHLSEITMRFESWLADSTSRPFASPLYWAAFTVWGA